MLNACLLKLMNKNVVLDVVSKTLSHFTVECMVDNQKVYVYDYKIIPGIEDGREIRQLPSSLAGAEVTGQRPTYNLFLMHELVIFIYVTDQIKYILKEYAKTSILFSF